MKATDPVGSESREPAGLFAEVVVTIPAAEVQRYFTEAYDELVPKLKSPASAAVARRESLWKNNSKIGSVTR